MHLLIEECGVHFLRKTKPCQERGADFEPESSEANGVVSIDTHSSGGPAAEAMAEPCSNFNHTPPRSHVVQKWPCSQIQIHAVRAGGDKVTSVIYYMLDRCSRIDRWSAGIETMAEERANRRDSATTGRSSRGPR